MVLVILVSYLSPLNLSSFICWVKIHINFPISGIWYGLNDIMDVKMLCIRQIQRTKDEGSRGKTEIVIWSEGMKFPYKY